MAYSDLVNKIVKNQYFREFILLFLAILAGIYINLFTNNPAFNNFFGLKLTALADTWFMAVFGLVAIMAIIKAGVSLSILAIFTLIIGFFLFRVYEIYMKILNQIRKLKQEWLVVIVLIVIALIEFGFVLYFWKLSKGIDIFVIFEGLICILLIMTAKVLADILQEILKKKEKK